MRWCWCLIFTWICLVLTHWHRHLQVEMLLISDILTWLGAYHFALAPENYACSGETPNTNFIAFGLTRPRFEVTVYRTVVHPNHYTTNTAGPILKDDTCTFKTPPYIHLLTSYLFVYMRIYIYVWKLNQIVLELDFRAVNLLFFPRRDLNPHHWYTAAPFAKPYMSSALDHSTTSISIYIYSYQDLSFKMSVVVLMFEAK